MSKQTATLLDRTKSSTIDTLILITLAFIIAELLSNFENVPTWIRTLLFSSLVIYEPICITFGTTIGNHIMNIRIRRSSNDSKKLNILRSVIRFISKLFFGWISYVTIFKNPRKRAIHDLITGATTIKV
ncbi:RDD family protein [Flavobacterium amnicola]|uniref:RDD family protein n=1 Tax=Flavobacterium amnicola TaxID=2506422 RepID=A0A4Q1K6X4_9FLAO|nr:RDD family protein [Flavobacterium amnicola]